MYLKHLRKACWIGWCINVLFIFIIALLCRCIMTTIDPKDGTRDPDMEPLMTLKKFLFYPHMILSQIGLGHLKFILCTFFWVCFKSSYLCGLVIFSILRYRPLPKNAPQFWVDNPLFGVNLVAVKPGVIRVGDPVFATRKC